MTEPAPAPSGAKKDDRRKQTIIAASAVLGVLLTYVLIRRSQAASTTAASTPVDTTAADQQATDDSATQSALSNLSDQLSGLPAAIQLALTPATPVGETTAAPVATASTLFAPSTDAIGYETVTGAGPNQGLGVQVQPDGSLLALTASQWSTLQSEGDITAANTNQVNSIGGAPAYWTQNNISNAPVNQQTTPVEANQAVP